MPTLEACRETQGCWIDGLTGTGNRWRTDDTDAGHGWGPSRMAEILLNDVAERAKTVLSRSRIYDLRRLQVEQDGETLLLSGRVDSFYHKQLAQELVRTAVEGVEVSNAISVVYNPRRADSDLDWTW